jgi:ankyrin repeat protein
MTITHRPTFPRATHIFKRRQAMAPPYLPRIGRRGHLLFIQSKKPEDLAEVTTELFDTLQCRSSQDGTDKIKTLLTSIPASDLDTLRADNGLTALEIAVDRKNLLAIRLRVEHGVNPNNATPGFTLAIDVIHVAAERGNLELTQLLINRGIDLNVSPNGGNTPLMLAAWKGHLAIVKLMVKNGARLGLGSAGGRNVLMAAMQTGKLDVIRFLLDANKSASDPFDINQQDESGHTTLSLAYVKHGAWRRNASENEKDVQDTIFFVAEHGG